MGEADGPVLAPAGMASRAGKAITGLLQLSIVAQYLSSPGIAVASAPIDDPGYWIVAVLAVLLLPWTVNIGFNRAWGRRPLLAAAIVLGLAFVMSRILFGAWWGVPVSMVVYGVSVYVHGHMGACHVLAALIGTRGCEMRAPAHLIARLRGQAASFSPCPGFWTPLDNWEHRLRAGVGGTAS